MLCTIQTWKTDYQNISPILNGTQMWFSNPVKIEIKIRNTPDVELHCATFMKTAHTVILLHGLKQRSFMF